MLKADLSCVPDLGIKLLGKDTLQNDIIQIMNLIQVV